MTGAEPWPEPQSLPSAHWLVLSGFLLFPPRDWSGAGFPPLSLSLPPPSLSLAPRTGVHRLPPAPREGRDLEKKFPRSLD